MQLNEISPEYPAVTKENSEIEREVLLNDYKKKRARARKEIFPVNFLIESESDDEREKISNLVEYICGSDEAQDNALEMLPSIYEASFKTKDKVLNILPSLYELKETSQTFPHANKITIEQEKLSQLITPKKEKQKSPPQPIQASKDSVSLSSPQIVTETFKIQDKEAEDLPSIHDVKQIHQSKITNEMQKSSQLTAPNKEKQKSPLQLSEACESSMSSLQIVTTFPKKKQSSITKVFETFRIQGEKVLRDSPSIYEMNQSQQNKITMEQHKSSPSQLITPKKEKLKSPPQLIQSSESPISSSSPQITAFTEKKQLHMSEVFETYTIQDKEIEDSPSVHEKNQTQHLNKVTTEQEKSSQMTTPSKEKQKSPLQLSQSFKSPISTSPQIITTFPEEKQSRFPQIFEALSEQQDFHPEGHAVTPINDSGIAAENSLSIIETDEETELRNENSGGQTVGKNKKNEVSQKYKKPQRICKFCYKLQSRLKHHILTKHSKEPTVEPL